MFRENFKLRQDEDHPAGSRYLYLEQPDRGTGYHQQTHRLYPKMHWQQQEYLRD